MSDGSDFPIWAALMEEETDAYTGVDVIIAISTFAEERGLCMQKHYVCHQTAFQRLLHVFLSNVHSEQLLVHIIP
jgi:hypothetical protein